MALLILATLLCLVGASGCSPSSGNASPRVSSSRGSTASRGATASRRPPTPGQTTALQLTSTGVVRPVGHDGRYVTVGLGDSVPSAAGCSGCTAFIAQAGARAAAAAGTRSVVQNEAVAGYTSGDVVNQLADATVRSRIADSDLVIITVGANDLADALSGSCDDSSGCLDAVMRAVDSRLTSIVTRVKALQAASDATVVITGYWNVGIDGEVGRENGEDYVATSRALTRRFNAMVVSLARTEDVTYADIYTPLVGTDGTRDPTTLLADDGDHPNAAGHALLAAAVVKALGLT